MRDIFLDQKKIEHLKCHLKWQNMFVKCRDPAGRSSITMRPWLCRSSPRKCISSNPFVSFQFSSRIHTSLFSYLCFFCCCPRLCLCPCIVCILQITNGSPTREENVQNSLRFVPCFAGWKCTSYIWGGEFNSLNSCLYII